MNGHPVILFDGVCNYCNGIVNFLIRADRKRRFLFATQQSETGQRLLREHGLPPDAHDSFVLIEGDRVSIRSTAVLRVIRYLPWWCAPGRIGWLLPRRLRDGLYKWTARNRYRWFGKRESCMIPTPDVRSRFLN